MFLSAFAAYGFARIQFKGRETLFLIYLSMMMVPPQVSFVPKFLMFEWRWHRQTHWALILPGMFTIFGVFMLRQFFLSVPSEISEAAFIDGAGHLRIFFRLILPLAKPALATLAIIDFSCTGMTMQRACVPHRQRPVYRAAWSAELYSGEQRGLQCILWPLPRQALFR